MQEVLVPSAVSARARCVFRHAPAAVTWFAQPNPWLADRLPADTLELDRSAVLHAARADRLLAIC